MAKILFVEDDPFISEIYTKKFTLSGFEVVQSLTGRDALKKVHENSFDLILLDLVLPELSGMDVLRELRTNRDYAPDLKVIVFSNLSGPQERQDALAAGANGFISKTEFTPSEVVTEVKRQLGQFAAREEHAARATASEPAITATLPGGPSGSGEESQILLIEDEPVFVEIFGKALRDAGLTVVTERNGQTGLERALNGNFKLIITDHLLPGMTGKAIVEMLRHDARTKDVPVFLLTASLEEEEVKLLESSGMVARSFLKTKVTPSELAAIAQEFLEVK